MGSKIHRAIRRRSYQSHYVRLFPLFHQRNYNRACRPSWGESAGAISAALHMLADGGNTGGLFRAAFMESGAPIPVGDITHGQKYYDSIVASTGCSGAADTLACLRTVSYASLKAAINQTPSIFAYQVKSPL